MNEAQIEEVFKQINKLGEFACHKTHQQPKLFVYTAKPNDGSSKRRQNFIIDINFYLQQNSTIFLMYISKGYSGIQSQLIDRLLMIINSITRAGFFAYYYHTGDVIFRRDIPTDYLNSQKITDILQHFEQVYNQIKPLLESYTSEWGLQDLSSTEHKQFIKELKWHFTGLERTLAG